MRTIIFISAMMISEAINPTLVKSWGNTWMVGCFIGAACFDIIDTINKNNYGK